MLDPGMRATIALACLLACGGEPLPSPAPARAPVAPPASPPGNERAETSTSDFGKAGLDVLEIGEGGGGRGDGPGVCTWGDDAGAARADLRASRSSKGIRAGEVTVDGTLTCEVVHRIVRQRFDRFRLCYDNGLRSNPGLQGKVNVRFVIGRSGSVEIVQQAGSSTLGDKNMIDCVVRVFASLSYPKPDAGPVSVVYPLLFTLPP